MPDLEKVKTTIEALRDIPADTGSAGLDVLSLLTDFLLDSASRLTHVHWFCDRADKLTIDVATFLLRLHAYDSDVVQSWRQNLAKCLKGCCGCIRGLSEAKVSSRHTFFGAFGEETLVAFWSDFNNWELDLVRNALKDAKLTPNTSSNRTLNDVPPATICHIFTNIDILVKPDILSIIHSFTPSATTVTIPTDPLPPGLLLLAFHEDENSRIWARSYLKASKAFTVDQIVGVYLRVLDKITDAISVNRGTDISFPFSTDLSVLWSGVSLVLRLLPSEYFATAKARQLEIHRVVLGHLHDQGPHFIDVLRSLVVLCKRMGSELWTEEGIATDYPQVIFDAVKDNPIYTELLLKPDSGSWLMGWYMDYLHTIWNLPVLGTVVAKMVDFMCEELQHERFQELRPSVMVAAARLLASINRKAKEGGTAHQLEMSGNAVDIHCGVFISIAFDRAYNTEKWSDARKAAREVVKNVLVSDTMNVSDAITRLSRRLAGQQEALIVPSLRKQMWKEMYGTIQGNDADGMTMILSIVASSAHVDRLTPKAFRDLSNKEDGRAAENVFKVINEALDVFHTGFLDVVSKYANYNTSSTILDLLRRPGMVKDIMALMLSPIDEIQVAAQTLVGQAFDVDVRQDCFRALIENLPEPSLSGIFTFLDTFIHYAPVVPEACSLSKSIVRCMTDVIDVLCSSSDGLLRSQTFMKMDKDGPGPSGELPRWWKLMTQTISVIFKRTPTWSLYFGNEEMVVWMRDALIFGRDMLSQRRVIESAAIACSVESTTVRPGRLSRIGRKMVEDLKEVLPELGRWLRLTDEELLHQSFALLETLLACFKDTQVPPPEDGVAKLTKHIDDARKKDPKRPQTRLDSARLAKLENALAAFQVDDDDDVEVVSHTIHKVENSDSDVEIIAGPLRKLSQKTTLQVPKERKEGKMRFKPAKPTAPMPSTSNHTVSKFFTTGDKQPRIQPKARPQVIATKPPIGKVPPGKVEGRKGKAVVAEASSSSEASGSEDDSVGEGGLASLAKLQRTPKIKQPVERRQVKLMALPTENNAAMERLNRREALRRTQLRLKPDISPFHRTLLSWNYDHPDSEPPINGTKPQYLQVPDKFSNHDHYRRVFEPLLMMECWAQIVKAKDEPGEDYQCKITSRQFVDDWLDLDISIPDQVKKDWMLMETDVVVLRHLDGKKCIMGKTQAYRASHFGITATIRCFVGTQGDVGLQTNTTWRISKVLSLSTLHREYATLMAVPYYDFFDTILRPTLTRKPYIDRRDIEQAMDRYGVNEPQAAAILGSMRVDGFSLIQGPPGTGKTSTICGLVQAYLAKRPPPTTAITAGRTAGPADKSIPPKILLCAPSNAAIDEVAHRLKDGMLGSGKQGICPKVVRIGAQSSVNIGVKDISLDSLVDQKLNSNPDGNNVPKDASNEIIVIRKELDSVKKQRQETQVELSQIQNNTARTTALQDEIKRLNQRRMALTQQFDRLKDKQKSDFRTLDATRRRCRKEVLQEADVICGTLSGSGHETLQLEQFDFEMVIIDEAAQAIELSSLIPLKYKCRRCIMVGDPQQLPPTVLSMDACKFQYNQSLFVRFQKHKPDAVHLLSIQYRMHPDISHLPSRVFYNGKLLDGPAMDVKTKQPWHSHEKFGPYKFFNVSRGQEHSDQSHSLVNKLECQVAVALFARLRQEFSNCDFDFRVGVISMYRAQIKELRRAFSQRFGQDIAERVDFNTVDGFQGQEKDVIILSCVRAGPGLQSVGFLADTRRMNVALTRARSSLFILGHVPTLERSDPNWRQIIQDARSRMAMVNADVAYFTSRAPQPVVRSPPKPSKPPTPIPTVSVPTDLISPRDMKPPSARVIPSPPKNENLPTDSIPPVIMASSSSKKRPNPAGDTPRPPPPRPLPQVGDPQVGGESSRPKPKPPPPRREKGAPSLFIPKKRPAPDGDSGAPSAKRR